MVWRMQEGFQGCGRPSEQHIPHTSLAAFDTFKLPVQTPRADGDRDIF